MKKAQSIVDIMATPFYSQFTEEQIRDRLSDNHKQLQWCADKARSTGKRYNGQTAKQWQLDADYYAKLLV